MKKEKEQKYAAKALFPESVTKVLIFVLDLPNMVLMNASQKASSADVCLSVCPSKHSLGAPVGHAHVRS